jgi:hypothetical protein
MDQLAQQLRRPDGTSSQFGTPLDSNCYPLLSAVLLGGAFAYVVPEGDGGPRGPKQEEQEDEEEQLPHGVGDWTVSHHVWNQPPVAAAAAAGVAVAAAPAAHSTDQSSHLMACCPFPFYFHCESHRAGAVNWRARDVSLFVQPRTQAVALHTASVQVPSTPAYWLCVDGEAENLALFQRIIADLSDNPHYSIDDVYAPPLRSVEPLLRAGVCMHLLEQREHQLVILAPGTPHCVLTPPAVTKISRNWTTPQALLAATVRVLRGTSGERAQWIRYLNEQPLQCILQALRRLYIDQPVLFGELSSVHLRFVLGRAMADPNPALQPIALQVASWMHQKPALPQATRPGVQTERADCMDLTLDGVIEEEASAAQPQGAVCAVSAAAAAVSAPTDSFEGRCRAYRDLMAVRLSRDCSLASALHLLDGLLLASVPPSTVHELCAELALQQPDIMSAQGMKQTIDAAHKQGYGRAAKRARLEAAEQEVLTRLQVKLQRAGAPLPDMWQKLAHLRTRLEARIAPEQRR